MFLNNFTNFVCVWFWSQIVNFQKLLDDTVTLIKQFLTPNWILGLDIPKSCKLIEVSSKSISSMFECLISSTDEATTFYHIVSTIESWGWEVLVNWMNFEVFEWIDRSRTVLPNISHNIIEVTCFEKVNRVWREPVFHIDISSLSMKPLMFIFSE